MSEKRKVSPGIKPHGQVYRDQIAQLKEDLAAAQREIERLTQDCARIASERACEMVARRKAEINRDQYREALEKIRTLPDQPAGLREVGDYAAIAKAALTGAGEEK